MNFVYFLEAEGVGRIKIGVTTRVPERLKALRAGSPVPLRLVGIIPDAADDLELRLLERFSAHRLHSEWFSDVPEIRSYVARYALSPVA